MATIVKKEFYRLSLKDLAIFYCCSVSTAKRRKLELQQAMNITKIRVLDLAKYEGVSTEVVANALFP